MLLLRCLLTRNETLKLCRNICTENSKISTTPCSIYDTVQSAFAVNNLSVLKECWADLLREIDAISECSIEQLLGAMSSTDHSLKRGYSPFCASVLLITKVGHQI